MFFQVVVSCEQALCEDTTELRSVSGPPPLIPPSIVNYMGTVIVVCNKNQILMLLRHSCSVGVEGCGCRSLNCKRMHRVLWLGKKLLFVLMLRCLTTGMGLFKFAFIRSSEEWEWGCSLSIKRAVRGVETCNWEAFSPSVLCKRMGAWTDCFFLLSMILFHHFHWKTMGP